MTFSERAWGEISSVYAAILDLPFIRELAAGTLSEERFRFYMVQDALYLTEFSRVLSIAAARAHNQDAMIQFAEYAQQALSVERALHQTFFHRFGISSDDAARAEMTPTCSAYTNYLLATAYHTPFAVLVAAVLPCFWIYWKVGEHIRADAMAANPYRLWIDTYGEEAFGRAVRSVIRTADREAEAVAPVIVTGMGRAFRRASQLEWMFWDSAYRLERWPV